MQPTLKEWRLMYLPWGSGIYINLPLHPHLLSYSIIYAHQFGLTDTYLVFWVRIPCVLKKFILFFKFFQFWPLASLSVGSFAPFASLHQCIFFFFVYFCTLWNYKILHGERSFLLLHKRPPLAQEEVSNGASPDFPFLWPSPVGSGRHFITVGWECKFSLPSWPLSAWMVMESKFFLWCLTEVKWLLSKNFLSRIFLSWSFGWKEHASGCYLFI